MSQPRNRIPTLAAAIAIGMTLPACGTETVTAPPSIDLPPTAQAQTVEVESESEIEITLRGNDPEGFEILFSIVTEPVNGTLGPIAQDGGTSATLTYQSDPGFVGTDQFTFSVDDGLNNPVNATVTITVTEAEGEPPRGGDR